MRCGGGDPATNLARRFTDREVRAGRDLASESRKRTGLSIAPRSVCRLTRARVPTALLRPDLWVADIVYTPLETQLLRDATHAGCRTLNGGRMAVFRRPGLSRYSPAEWPMQKGC